LAQAVSVQELVVPGRFPLTRLGVRFALMDPQLDGVGAERPLGAIAAQLRRVPEYVRYDMRAKVFGLLFTHSAALLALTKLTVFLLSLSELVETSGMGATTIASVPEAAGTESSGTDDPNQSHVWSLIGWAILGVFLVIGAGISVAEIFNMFELGTKNQYGMCNVFLVAALLQLQQEFQLRTLLLEPLFILSATLILTTVINLALSARLRALSPNVMEDSAVQCRWTARGIVLAGVKVAGPAPSSLPSLPLLLAWLAAAWLGHACVGAHSNAVVTSFAVVWLFLIDADGPLQNGDPDDHLRIVVLLHSKIALLLLTTALEQLCVAVIGHGRAYSFLRVFLFHLVLQVNPAVRKFVLHVWPGAPPAERLEAERLRLELERLKRLKLEAQQLMLEAESLSWETDADRKAEILRRLQQILQEMSPARHRAAREAEGHEPPV